MHAPHFAVFRQIAPGLPHNPNRHACNWLAPARAQEQSFPVRRAMFHTAPGFFFHAHRMNCGLHINRTHPVAQLFRALCVPAARFGNTRSLRKASDVISESACVNAKTDGTGRTQSSLRPQKGAWNYSPGVSHSSCEPEAHDVLALTPGWSDLDQDLDPDTSVFAAARGTRLRPDAAPPLQSLSDVLCVRAVFDTTD